MYKLNLKTPHIKLNVSRKVVYIVAGAVVLLALFSFAVVSQVKAERAQAETARVKQAQTAQLEKQRDELLTKQTAQLTAETAKNDAICEWVRGVQAQRRQVVPPLCRR